MMLGGRDFGRNIRLERRTEGTYSNTNLKGWKYRSVRHAKEHTERVVVNTLNGSLEEWEQTLSETDGRINMIKDRQRSRKWWNEFWQRSYIAGGGGASEPVRNYTLFRYMLGCHAYGDAPTKFNGGLFTFDPVYVDEKSSDRKSVV